ncbi:hypothetical protein [Paraconexibacter algicola]|uniref:HAMP domain-containing protein n=1 Tax=Paraconexibacter algicola TaxID=2133960 RepID=A0A2T4UDV5_9ACTN|nr:hypothetical protein [Paraconexibacter algicola]PTL55694.1 hypothetical protein C7Y72_18865 [Paraconexibacter algicola]
MSIQDLDVHNAPAPGFDETLDELQHRLRSLDEHCLTSLEQGLGAMVAGDFTVTAAPVTEPIHTHSDNPQIRGLIDLFNAMLARSQATLVAYEQLRQDLAEALGDLSCLPELYVRLSSLEEHCLTDLDEGLQAMVDGDLTRAAAPVTRPLIPEPDQRLGQLGELFNLMLARSRTALHSYDTMREELRVALGDRSCLDELRASLASLHRHCLRDLDEGLEAVATGTSLTRRAVPATKPLEPAEGGDLGELGEVFNRMLARTQSSLAHYDELRRTAFTGLRAPMPDRG